SALQLRRGRLGEQDARPATSACCPPACREGVPAVEAALGRPFRGTALLPPRCSTLRGRFSMGRSALEGFVALLHCAAVPCRARTAGRGSHRELHRLPPGRPEPQGDRLRGRLVAY